MRSVSCNLWGFYLLFLIYFLISVSDFDLTFHPLVVICRLLFCKGIAGREHGKHRNDKKKFESKKRKNYKKVENRDAQNKIFNHKQQAKMEKKLIYLVYQTDAWHSVETRKLVYIGENLEETIRKMVDFLSLTEEDAKQLSQWRQTSCNNRDFEVMIERQFVNDFTV